MEIKLADDATGLMLAEKKYPLNFTIESAVEVTDSIIKGNDYEIHLKEKWFDGVHISEGEIFSDEPISLDVFHSSDHICFLFCLKGILHGCLNTEAINLFSLQSGQQFVAIAHWNTIKFSAFENARFTLIQVSQQYYYKLTGAHFETNALKFSKLEILPEINMILQGIQSMDCQLWKRRMFLESKIHGLLVFFMEWQEKQDIDLFKDGDIGKIRMAKQILEENLRGPHSLIELSRRVGINDYKLKKGFKALVGETVFGYLNKIRMEQARKYLTEDKKAVGEVAFLVGYKNPQHFITAFKKRYAVLPGSLNKLK